MTNQILTTNATQTNTHTHTPTHTNLTHNQKPHTTTAII